MLLSAPSEAIRETGDLPINVKFLIEGEEEIGGSYIETFIKENQELLACDFFLNPDTGMQAPDQPTITYALRGIAYFELRVQGPKQDMHSGSFGGAIHNPAQVMTDLLSGTHDEKGRVTLPGFYDRVKPLDDDERKEISKLPIDDDFYLGTGWCKSTYLVKKDTPPLSAQAPVPHWRSTASTQVLLMKARKQSCLPMQWLKYPAGWWRTRIPLKFMNSSKPTYQRTLLIQ